MSTKPRITKLVDRPIQKTIGIQVFTQVQMNAQPGLPDGETFTWYELKYLLTPECLAVANQGVGATTTITWDDLRTCLKCMQPGEDPAYAENVVHDILNNRTRAIVQIHLTCNDSPPVMIMARQGDPIERVLSMIIQDVDANIHDFSIVGITPPPPPEEYDKFAPGQVIALAPPLPPLHVTVEERNCIWRIDRFPPIYRIDDVDEARRLGDLEITKGDVWRANVLGKREDLRWVGSTAIDHLRPIGFTHPDICVALGYQPYWLVHLQCNTDPEYSAQLKEYYNVMKLADEYAIVGELPAPCWIRTNSSFESSEVDEVYEVRNAQNRKIIIRMIKNTISRDATY